jgi:FKBP-type peptidyl-prolyl cis-trans isomerase FkpA
MSVTTVPILPTPRSSLVTLWAGVGAAILIAGGAAWWGTAGAVGTGCSGVEFAESAGAVETTGTGLTVQTIKAGKGTKPGDADVVLVNYKGTLADGKEFDAGQRVPFPVQGLVPGFSEGLKMMQRGGSYKMCIPSALGYGAQANERIPANSTLVFEVDLLDFKSMAEIQAMQQEMQQQGGAGALPGGAMPGGAPHSDLPAGGGQ